ncbi:MAG: HlyC/CorC family transporter [Rhodocyclaceae bacterium]
MYEYPFSALGVALALLLILSGFFSMAETAMMAANRYRLKARAEDGETGARLAVELLGRTDRLLGVILLFNNLINAGAATLASVIAIELFGDDKWALGGGTLAVTFLILVFSEITPKVIGASYADRLAPAISYALSPLLKAFNSVVAFVNLFVSALLLVMGLKQKGAQAMPRLSAEELRVILLESGQFIPQKHKSILLNLFELEDITVEDVMTPRGAIEAIDIRSPIAHIREQLATSYHRRLPVYDGDPNNVIGILHQRRVLDVLAGGELTPESVRERLAPAYFVPANTPAYTQLQYFQENRQRAALVVDEYGEIQGMVTLEDLIEEMIGKFTTDLPAAAAKLQWDDAGSILVEGSRNLRELNRKLGLDLPLDGPKTLNGLILEHFQDIPESGMSLKIANVQMEVVHTQDRRVKTVRLYRAGTQ